MIKKKALRVMGFKSNHYSEYQKQAITTICQSYEDDSSYFISAKELIEKMLDSRILLWVQVHKGDLSKVFFLARNSSYKQYSKEEYEKLGAEYTKFTELERKGVFAAHLESEYQKEYEDYRILCKQAASMLLDLIGLLESKNLITLVENDSQYENKDFVFFGNEQIYLNGKAHDNYKLGKETANFLYEVRNQTVIPTQSLIEIYKNNYQTLDDIKINESLSATLKVAHATKWAARTTGFLALVTLLSILSMLPILEWWDVLKEWGRNFVQQIIYIIQTLN